MKKGFKKAMTAVSLYAALVGSAFAFHPVNVNTADAEEIADGLKGIGQSKAEAIVEYRKNNGPFKSQEDLLNVRGFGEKTLEKNRDYVLLK